MNITPERITHLEENGIFVFGANEAGRHGKGAAWLAKTKFGAAMGIGVGFHGQSYAIPTKDCDLEVLPIEVIASYVRDFVSFAKKNRHLTFFVTKIGCGLANYKPEQIAPLFSECVSLSNVYLPLEFLEILNK